MIYYLHGKVKLCAETFCVLDVNGVGYQVFLNLQDISKLPNINEELDLFIYHLVREDQQSLYGFFSLEDRNFFVLLTTVSGVGPKIALTILSHIPTKELIHAIVQEDVSLLSGISGIGAKKASRLIIELKDKLPKIFEINHAEGSSVKSINLGELQNDLTLGLRALGYNGEEIKAAFKNAKDRLKPTMSLEEGIKELLRAL